MDKEKIIGSIVGIGLLFASVYVVSRAWKLGQK